MTELSFTCVNRLLPATCQNIFIGYSGGVDSQVLLHLCAVQTDLRPKITAVYVHHGLQASADDWAIHSRQQCQRLAVNFTQIKVNAQPKPGQSPEAVARQARYAALRELIGKHDVLLLAQHREDQLETVLLQLFRGSGLSGLAAMPAVMDFGGGQLLRPLLDTAKADIQQYAAQHCLQWVEDPSNQCNDFDRNFLRNEILPVLKQRWPSLDKAVARSAGHCAAAQQILDATLVEQLAALSDATTRSFKLDGWRQIDAARQNLLLRAWLQDCGLRPPSQAVLNTIIKQLILAGDTANPQVLLQNHAIRKYRQKLFCLPAAYFQRETGIIDWEQDHGCIIMLNGYSLVREVADSGIDQQLWRSGRVTIGFRQGGELLKLVDRDGHHCLKKLFQAAGIPPWERDLRPLIYIDQRLAAVAGLWVAEWAWRQAPGYCYRLDWRP